jgi:hypothetical protein
MMDASEENQLLNSFLAICKSTKKLGIRTNADTPEDAAKARQFGAEGIGLFRTEHMFYGKGSEEPLFRLRKMIVSKTEEERRKALAELFPYMKKDIKGTLKTQFAYLLARGLDLLRSLRGAEAAVEGLRGQALRVALEKPPGWQGKLFAQIAIDEGAQVLCEDVIFEGNRAFWDWHVAAGHANARLMAVRAPLL